MINLSQVEQRVSLEIHSLGQLMGIRVLLRLLYGEVIMLQSLFEFPQSRV